VKVGLLGGTFDPIHLGHLRAAETAREGLGLERVAFVPAGVPPHRGAPQASAIDRYAMAALATACQPAFVVSDMELCREGPSYTVDTLRAWRRARPEDELVLLLGSDAYAEMSGWREVDALRALCEVAVLARPGEAREPGGTGALRLAGPALDVSSSEIRSRVAQGRSVRYLVPEAVADYITKRGLYR
jgi:nicotinate-nucleotide adenylyltransferase